MMRVQAKHMCDQFARIVLRLSDGATRTRQNIVCDRCVCHYITCAKHHYCLVPLTTKSF